MPYRTIFEPYHRPAITTTYNYTIPCQTITTTNNYTIPCQCLPHLCYVFVLLTIDHLPTLKHLQSSTAQWRQINVLCYIIDRPWSVPKPRNHRRTTWFQSMTLSPSGGSGPWTPRKTQVQIQTSSCSEHRPFSASGLTSGLALRTSPSTDCSSTILSRTWTISTHDQSTGTMKPNRRPKHLFSHPLDRNGNRLRPHDRFFETTSPSALLGIQPTETIKNQISGSLNNQETNLTHRFVQH